MLCLYTIRYKVYKCMGFGSVTATNSQCTVSFTWINDRAVAVLLDILAVFYVDITEAV